MVPIWPISSLALEHLFFFITAFWSSKPFDYFLNCLYSSSFPSSLNGSSNLRHLFWIIHHYFLLSFSLLHSSFNQPLYGFHWWLFNDFIQSKRILIDFYFFFFFNWLYIYLRLSFWSGSYRSFYCRNFFHCTSSSSCLTSLSCLTLFYSTALASSQVSLNVSF